MKILLVALKQPLSIDPSDRAVSTDLLWLDRLSRGLLGQMIHRMGTQATQNVAVSAPLWLSLTQAFFDQIVIFSERPSKQVLQEQIHTVEHLEAPQLWQRGMDGWLVGATILSDELLDEILRAQDTPLYLGARVESSRD